MADDPIVNFQFREIKDDLGEIKEKLNVQNGFKGEAQRWIAQTAVTLEQIKDRQDAADEMLVAHQTFIDQRVSELKDHELMKAKLDGVDLRSMAKDLGALKDAQAGQKGSRRLVIDVMCIATGLGTVALAIIEIVKHG